MDRKALTRGHVAVLEAMTKADPSPPQATDSLLGAVDRRLRRVGVSLGQARLRAYLRDLKVAGAIDLDPDDAHLPITALANLKRHITHAGWHAIWDVTGRQ
jgi:hypothetical protein